MPFNDPLENPYYIQRFYNVFLDHHRVPVSLVLTVNVLYYVYKFVVLFIFQVIHTSDERDVRFLGGLVLSRKSEPQFACNLKSGDLQTPATYQLINSCSKEIHIANRQYLFNIQHLKTLLSGPVVFHPEVHIQV